MAEPKQTWLERAIETHKFHVAKRKENRKWRMRDTARCLKRAIGCISEDLKVASWAKTHRDKLESIEHLQDALIWIREREEDLELDEVE